MIWLSSAKSKKIAKFVDEEENQHNFMIVKKIVKNTLHNLDTKNKLLHQHSSTSLVDCR